MIGEKYGFLEIVEEAGTDKYHIKQVKVKCVCGKEKVVAYSALKKGQVKSCGCKRSELIKRYSKNSKVKRTELSVSFIKKRIEFLREEIAYLKGKTPNNMTKSEYLDFYMTNARICELQNLIMEE